MRPDDHCYSLHLTVQRGGQPCEAKPRGGDTSTATSALFTPSATGVWCFASYYSGDSSYAGSTDITTDECFAVTLPACNQVTITTTSLPPATVGVPYSYRLYACGGIPPYTWNKYGPAGTGVLPPHVHPSREGSISGIPRKAGVYTITIKCLDSTHSHKTQATQQLTLTIDP